VSNAERLLTALTPAMPGEEFVVSEESLNAMVDAIRPLASDDLTVVMRAFDVERSFDTVEGMRDAWLDWIEPWETLAFRFEEVQELGENVLTRAMQVGVTRRDGIKVEQPSAAVWKFRGSGLYRIEFHLDRAAEVSARGGP
jgi:ketosteroid isomerase-like protein